MKKINLVLPIVLFAVVGLTWNAYSDRDGEQRERERDERPERDTPKERDRDQPRERDREESRDREQREGAREGQNRELEAFIEKRRAEINSLREQGKTEAAQKLAQDTERIIARHRQAMKNREREHGNKERENRGEDLEHWVQQQERKIHQLREAGRNEEA